jgi:hypothetical protein
MRKHAELGRAERAGTVPGLRGQDAVKWRITPAGATWLAHRALAALVSTADAEEARIHARDLQVATDRMVQFRVTAGRRQRWVTDALSAAANGSDPQ